jgi:hypothetical protein
MDSDLSPEITTAKAKTDKCLQVASLWQRELITILNTELEFYMTSSHRCSTRDFLIWLLKEDHDGLVDRPLQFITDEAYCHLGVYVNCQET